MNGSNEEGSGQGLSFEEVPAADEPSIGDEVHLRIPEESTLEMAFDQPTVQDVTRLLDQIEDHLGRLELDEYVRQDLFKEVKGVRQLLADEGAPRELLPIAMDTVTKKLEAVYDTGENVRQLLPWAQMAREMVKGLY